MDYTRSTFGLVLVDVFFVFSLPQKQGLNFFDQCKYLDRKPVIAAIGFHLTGAARSDKCSVADIINGLLV